MNLFSLKRASTLDVERYFTEELKLSPYQKEKAHDVFRESPYYFYESKEKTKSVWVRSTIFAWFVAFVLLVIFLPVNFIITGRWGYDDKKIRWYINWTDSLGLG